MYRVAILSPIVIDEIHTAGGGSVTVEVGGAGAYAAVGASLAGVAGSAVLVSGVGTSDREVLSGWCSRRGIDPAGLFDVGERSPRTHIQYFADGEREESPVFGLEHFEDHTPFPRHIPESSGALSGVYLFHDHESAYWQNVHQFKSTFSGPVLWEISLDACRPDALDAVFDRLEAIEVLSINQTEAFALLDVTELADAVRLLGHVPALVLLRRGARGSLLLDHGCSYEVGTAPTRALDPTGGGNSYSGAFLATFARTGDPEAASRVAAAAASTVVAAGGSPEITDALRQDVHNAARQVSIVRL